MVPSGAGNKYKLKDSDYVFGGWINLDLDHDQSFTCLKGSHNDLLVLEKKQGSESGFATTGDRADTITDKITVPPGHMVVFFQRILHVVTPHKVTFDSFRQFTCWRLTLSSVDEKVAPLNGWEDFNTTIMDFGVPKLPSGQIPPMYSANHASCFLFKDNKNDPIWWSKKVKAICKEDKVCKGKKHAGRKYTVCKRFLPSLRELGLHGGMKPYKQCEIDMMTPSTTFVVPKKLTINSVNDIMTMGLIRRVQKGRVREVSI
jgi:hypothetical protein